MLTPPPPTPPPPPRARGPLLVAVTVLVAAAGLAVWGLVALVSANNDRHDAELAVARAGAQARPAGNGGGALGIARTRDEVAESARKTVAVLNTLDYRTLDESLDAWAEVTTGALREEIDNLVGSQREQLLAAKTVTEAQVVSVGVRDLDTDAGTATALAAVKVTKSAGGARPTTVYQRIEATLSNTDDGWKLSGLSAVPYVEPEK